MKVKFSFSINTFREDMKKNEKYIPAKDESIKAKLPTDKNKDSTQ